MISRTGRDFDNVRAQDQSTSLELRNKLSKIHIGVFLRLAALLKKALSK